MKNESDKVTPLDMMRAKTGVPVVGGGVRVQFPGMREYRRSRWERVKGVEGRANCFHVMSRIVDGLEFFSDEDREALVVLLFKMARFCRVKVLTYCVMGNHFHALIEVADGEKVRARFRDPEKGWERLFGHLSCLYSKSYIALLRKQVEAFLKAGRADEAEEIREAFLSRMGDLSRFMWEFKERYTKWFNKVHGRRGALWQGRFKSVLVQGGEDAAEADGGYSKALRTVAAYIDLNPVRAGLVEDPADYRWCGYAAALGGSKRARRGLNAVMGSGVDRWEEDGTHDRYRLILLHHGLDSTAEDGQGSVEGKRRKGMDTAKRSAELRKLHARVRKQAPVRRDGPDPKDRKTDKDGKSTARPGTAPAPPPDGDEAEWYDESGADFVRGKYPSFTRGLAIGAKAWVEGVFERHRQHFGAKRKDGGRRAGPEGLYALRRLPPDDSGKGSGD